MQKFLCILALALLVVAVPATAKTPDGQTPSEETVCDGLSGAQKGLCTAYCEAMDCDHPERRASATACSRVRSNFMKHSGGLPPPCDVTCPCPEFLPLFAAFVSGTEPINECIITPGTISVTTFDTPSQFSMVVGDPTPGFCHDNLMPPFVPLTDAEARVCRLLLRDAAEAQNVECVPPE